MVKTAQQVRPITHITNRINQDPESPQLNLPDRSSQDSRRGHARGHQPVHPGTETFTQEPQLENFETVCALIKRKE